MMEIECARTTLEQYYSQIIQARRRESKSIPGNRVSVQVFQVPKKRLFYYSPINTQSKLFVRL